VREINLNRQKLGLEDLLFGVGIVTQIRAGQNVDVTKINAGNLPFDETQSLLEWAQSINLEALGSMTTELQTIYDNLTTIGKVEDNLTVINTLEDNLVALQSLYTNIAKLQNIDTNMSKLQNIDTNMSKLQNIDTNMSKLQAIYTDLTKLESIYDNLTMLIAIYNNLTALNNINSQVIPNLTELLLVNDNAIQVAADKLTVSTDKGIVAGYKDDVSAMKVAVESIYDTFDDRFLGVKTSDPTLDNDGNALQDGAMYFNGSSNALKVYSLDNTTWYTIPQIYLSGLLDVTLTSITTGDILTWNGTKWVNTRTPSFDSVKLNGGTGTAGTATWNNTELTYDLVLNDNVTLQVGQEEVVYCKNNTLTTIPNGKPVMAVGTNGNSGNILIALHDGTKASAKRIIGVTTQAVLPSNNANPYGFVTRNGKVRGLNTTGSDYGETWVDGDILYVKATGALTKVEPADTALKMPIAFVIHAHSNGTLYVRTTGIDENHDRDLISTKVEKVTSTDNAVVRFDGTTGAVQNSGVVIDDNGNVGIEVVPSAWGTSLKSIDYLFSSDYSYITDIVGGGKAVNAYNTRTPLGSNTWEYKHTGYGASNYSMVGGIHYWDTAPSGIAGNAITWTNVMTLDSTSNLGIGVVPSVKLHLGDGADNTPSNTKSTEIVVTPTDSNWTHAGAGIRVNRSWLDVSWIDFMISSGNTARRVGMTLNASGNLLIGTTIDNGIDKLQVNGTISSGAIPAITEDLNTLKSVTKTYVVSSASSNIPALDYGYLEVIIHISDIWAMQRFTCLGALSSSTLAGRTFVRCLSNGGWTAWSEK